ncbi:GNS1/SUR4 family protein [Tieghemostelium lacteum]|uniref:Elongation of fatty acids protein n=1 Tax=Tieghemostelium lacteum TaxID=361077 RepID=A0A152A8F2_TIELA|nr:GNS1/SUR4 family protein [Tieghemostelium lacteum]|eukprot:KYR02529.1 GNS1/SUR4 family protein [Tieghemostelium lacteum]
MYTENMNPIIEQFNYLVTRYEYYMTRRDERTQYWPLLNRPHEMLSLVFGYLIMVYIGKRIMKNKKGLELQYPLIFHNLILLLISLYMTIDIAYQAITNDYSLFCNPVDYGQKGLGMARVLYVFFFSKAIEFGDTAFMILRGKLNQVTFLHVYHHSTMLFLWWIGLNFAAGGDAYFSALINSFVHVIMYGYYLLAALKYDVWWKKYLTQLQLTQFFVVMIAAGFTIYYQCDFINWMQYALIAYMISMLVLFGMFYAKAYLSGGGARKPKSKTQ